MQMIRVGEESGNLDAMLLELAKVHESDVESDIKRMLALLEPALILGMGRDRRHYHGHSDGNSVR